MVNWMAAHKLFLHRCLIWHLKRLKDLHPQWTRTSNSVWLTHLKRCSQAQAYNSTSRQCRIINKQSNRDVRVIKEQHQTPQLCFKNSRCSLEHSSQACCNKITQTPQALRSCPRIQDATKLQESSKTCKISSGRHQIWDLSHRLSLSSPNNS